MPHSVAVTRAAALPAVRVRPNLDRLMGVPRQPNMRSDVHLINVGSAGKPKGGDPRACYTLVELDDDVRATFLRVAYDVEAAARAIEATNLPHEFAAVLRTGGR